MNEKPVILVIDDQAANIELLEAYLVPKGYEIIKAASGEEGLAKISGNQIDLVLLDVMMPGMDGFEVTRRVRKDPQHHALPIILVTALRESEDRVKGIDAGCDDFLSKPVDKMELIARVQSLLKVKAYNDLTTNYQKELESSVSQRTADLKTALEKIKAASLDTIYRLSMASEYKDQNTGAHIKRMSRYCVAVARRLGLDESSLDTLLYAAPMHDLGKIGIPDLILMKPAKLDPVEWEIMKQHTVIGAKILEGSDAEFIKLGEIIALTHHEKWDGSGYPKGLKGQDIPISGRISAIADVFDALTSKRPYKDAFPDDQALAIIKDGRSNHFDPEVTDAFFAIQDQIIAIKQQYAEDDLKAFEIPALKASLQQYHPEVLPAATEITRANRTKAEDLINASEMRYRRLFEAAREGILILDAESGQIVEVNPFLIEMLGYSKEQMLGKKLWEIGLLKDVAASKLSFSELQSKKYLRYEDLPLERSDGKLINVEFVSIVYEVDHQKVIQCSIRDITHRKLVENILAEAAERESAISTLAFQLLSTVSIADVSELVLGSAQRFTASTLGFIGYLDLESGFMISPVMDNGIWGIAQRQAETDIFNKVSSSWDWILNNRKHLLTNTPDDDPRFKNVPLGSFPLRNLLALPALIGSELAGQIVLINSNRGYSQVDLEFVGRLATLYAIAIRHQRKDLEIRKLAYHDPLTGLPNRPLFNDRYYLALARAKRYHNKLGIMVLDIDNFKIINDTLGHSAGDEMLRDFSLILTSNLRQIDTVMRSGGDEFVIMLTDITNLEDIAVIAQKILEAIRQPFIFQNREVQITASMGISSFPENGEDIEMLLQYADIAMYHVKENKRDNFQMYVKGMEIAAIQP